MDLSKKQKTRRDAVEAPLFRTEQMLDRLEQIHTRVSAATKVWTETQRTLNPALTECDAAIKEVNALHDELAELWKQGAARMWK